MFAGTPEDPEPTSPSAPVVLRRSRSGGRASPERTTPPEGRGAALEAYRPDRRSVLLGAALVVALIVLGASLREGGLEWTAQPAPWLLIAPAAVAASARDWTTRLSAGSDWLRVGRRWVDTHRITDVRLSGAVRGRTLRLRDADGRRVRVHLGLLEANRELWSLVYSGLACSVQTGAAGNELAEDLLELHRFRS